MVERLNWAKCDGISLINNVFQNTPALKNNNNFSYFSNVFYYNYQRQASLNMYAMPYRPVITLPVSYHDSPVQSPNYNSSCYNSPVQSPRGVLIQNEECNDFFNFKENKNYESLE